VLLPAGWPPGWLQYVLVSAHRAVGGQMQNQRRQQRATEAKAPHRELDVNKERLFFVLTSIVGHKVTAKLRNNAIYEGVFHGCSLEPGDFSVTLKCARYIGGNSREDDQTLVIPTLVIPGRDFLQVSAADVSVSDVLMGDESSGRFATDTEITERQKGSMNTERDLVPWAGHGSSDAVGLDEGLGRGEPGQWDQFQANESRWGITTTFNEELYTTKLDPNSLPKEKREEADRIAREIESGQMASEIEGKVDGEDDDEEARFSAVQNNRRNIASENSGAAPSGNARDIAALSLPIGKDANQGSDNLGLSAMPGDGFTEHRRRGMITTHSPMRSSMISEMKRINALNLEPAVPKLDAKTGNDWINFKASQSRNSSKPIQGDGLKHELQQSLEAIQKRQQQQQARQAEQLANSGHAQGSMGQSDGHQMYSRKTDGQMHVGGESGKAKPFSFNPNAKDFTFNPSTPAFTPTNASSAAAQSPKNPNSSSQPVPQGPGPVFTVSNSDPFHNKKLSDILEGFFDHIHRDSWDHNEPKWTEAKGASFKEVLGQPNQQLQPMMAQLNLAGAMPGSWQPQQMAQMPPGAQGMPANAAPQMMGQPGYMMPNAPGGQPQQMFQPMYQGGGNPPGQPPMQQRPPQNPGTAPQGQMQPMQFNQQMVQQGNMQPQAMAMPTGMVQVQAGQNPGAVNMSGPMPKFGMQVMMVPAGYNPQQGFPQPQPMQGQPGPQQGHPGQPGQQGHPGPQGGGPQPQMMQQPVYQRQMGMAPPHQMPGHEG